MWPVQNIVNIIEYFNIPLGLDRANIVIDSVWEMVYDQVFEEREVSDEWWK